MKLTENFKLTEFTKSSTAQRLGLDNTPSTHIVRALTNLCQQVLQPLRDWYGKPIIVSSGYRSAMLNKAVGGVSNSQHMKGEAADLQVRTSTATAQTPSPASPKGGVDSIAGKNVGGGASTVGKVNAELKWLFEYIRDNLPFDQLILEHNKAGVYWIHVSCKEDVTKNRKQVIYDLLKK